MRVRWARVFAASLVAVTAFSAVGATAIDSSASATGPACTFNGGSAPIVTNAKANHKLLVVCTGLPANHPYLMLETSLLAGVNVLGQTALNGSSPTVAQLLEALAASPEFNLQSAVFPMSDASGKLTEDWTIPKSEPTDPNGTCPPPIQQANSGLLGCALAVLDLTTQATVGAASALIEYKHFSLFPPPPTLQLSTSSAAAGDTVSVSDVVAKKAKKQTYWWLPTLVSLDSLLGGPPGSPAVTATVGGVPVSSANLHISVASYDLATFTPPKISGSFTVPSGLSGPQTVTLSVGATLLAFPLTNHASATLNVTG